MPIALFPRFACILALTGCASASLAAPVLWSTQPPGLTSDGSASAKDEADTLDELTAPLGSTGPGLADDFQFETTFDAEIRALGDRLRNDSAPAPDDALPDDLLQPRLRDRSDPGD